MSQVFKKSKYRSNEKVMKKVNTEEFKTDTVTFVANLF